MKTPHTSVPVLDASGALPARRMLTAWPLLVLVLGLVLLAANAAAQSTTTGTVFGTVSDPTGAVVPLATVELANSDTSAVLSQTTNAAGQYLFSGVRPGPYKITVKMTGFSVATVPSVTVEVNKSVELNIALKVGADTQVVEVLSTSGTLLQTSDAQIGNSISKDL